MERTRLSIYNKKVIQLFIVMDYGGKDTFLYN